MNLLVKAALYGENIQQESRVRTMRYKISLIII
jgi:hypothetical protein